MLWYKSWLETRWRFLLGLALLVVVACGIVIGYPQIRQLQALVAAPDVGNGYLARRIRESAELLSTYRGYVWSQAFSQNIRNVVTIFAIVLGAGGLFSRTPGQGTLFTLSMPASRTRVLSTRVLVGLGELLVLAFAPSLVLLLMSAGVNQSYPVLDAMVHGLCLFVAAATFFSVAAFLSTHFDDLWRPLVGAFAAVTIVGVGFSEPVVGAAVSRYGIFNIMSGEDWFR